MGGDAGFLRLMTHQGIQKNPMKVSVAVGNIRQWLAQPYVQVAMPGDRHAAILFQILEQVGTAGNLTTDAHLASLAISTVPN